jgi:hypothetical protein
MKEDTTQVDATWLEKTGGYAKDMTLRDHFAGLAMQGFLGTVKVGCPDDLIAVDAYNLADAMLKERAK